MLEVDSLPEDLKKLISRKGEGNPFYIEEVVSSLLESDVLQRSNGTYALQRPIEQIRVPDTIQEIILSRIDRLEHHTREAIQLASVIGREFTFRLLNRIFDMGENLDERLEELKILELIYQKGYFPELSYMFKHALTQDVAYSTLLLERRKVLHGIIGAAIEKLYEDRLPEHYEILAYHYFEGENWEKGLEYLLKSAHKSFTAYSIQDAISYFDKALEVHKKIPGASSEILIEIYSGRAEVYATMANFKEANKNFKLLGVLAHTLGERTLEGQAFAGSASCLIEMHDFVKGKSMALEAMKIANEDNNDTVKTGSVYALCSLESMKGNLDFGLKGAIELVDLSKKTNQPDYEVYGYSYQNFIHTWSGQFEKAISIGKEAIKKADAFRKALPIIHIQWTNSLSLAGIGRYDEALHLLNKSTILGKRIDSSVYLSRILNTFGWVYNELCDWERAKDYNQKGLELALPLGDAEIITNAQLNIADSEMGRNNYDQALVILEDNYAYLPQQHEWMKWRYTQHLTHSLGEVLLHQGKVDRALIMADECLSLAEKTNSRKYIVKGWRLRGQVFLKQGEYMEAEKEFSKALAIAQEIGNPPQLWKTYIALGDLRQAQKKKGEALQAYHNAMNVIETVAKGLKDQSLKKSFLNSDHVKSIIKKAGK